MNRTALKAGPAVFKFCNLIFILNQEVDVIQTIHQTMLLVGIDLESLATSGCLVGHFLFGKIYFHFRLRISSNTAEQLLQELFAHHYRQYEVVQLVVLVDIRKETGDHDTEPIACNGPRCMLTA